MKTITGFHYVSSCLIVKLKNESESKITKLWHNKNNEEALHQMQCGGRNETHFERSLTAILGKPAGCGLAAWT